MPQKVGIKVKAKDKEKETFLFFDEKKIEVHKYLTISQMKFLLNIYLEKYATVDDDTVLSQFPLDPLGAQVDLDVNLLAQMTNVKVDSSHFHIDDIYGTSLIQTVKSKIGNWPIFEEILGEYREFVRADLFSLRGVISSTLEAFTNLDEDKIKEMGEAVLEIKDSISNSPIASLMDEGKDEKQNL